MRDDRRGETGERVLDGDTEGEERHLLPLGDLVEEVVEGRGNTGEGRVDLANLRSHLPKDTKGPGLSV